ncbi:vanadium-dependent haloperoxidase [Ramlibacter solisilvae]|uniref:vanadium-dependent haloperoxidase n=1 Tax=Ramlibacter tataouinensis TaxID=94132 RepID=UPI000776E675|nr:vanadium-dependent haloperoxidase [Ramlibacter tataouinensis]
MQRFPTLPFALAAAALASGGFLAACGGNDGDLPVLPVELKVTGHNAVSYWNEVAGVAANGAPVATGTPEERLPNYAIDMATLNLAIYDAVMAIVQTHRPYAVTPTAPATGASQDAAVAAAAYGVLKGLFPNRSATYQAAYDAYVAGLPDGEAKTRGLALGAEAAAGLLALRANDGRTVALAPFVPGTQPGEFRGINPVGRNNPFIKPFSMTSASQFRTPGPPALSSTAYAADLNETKALGSATSTTRTAAQTELARFATENPGIYWVRNVRAFAMTSAGVASQARLMALVWTSQADASIACFESKYHYGRWRPTSAITLADTDGNDATVADPGWTPVVPTPNHPEYPAAHGCITGTTMQALRNFHGTSQISFSVDSTVTNTTRTYTSTDALTDDMTTARIAGGMHFRTSSEHGAALGRNVADWVAARHFQPR